MLLHHRLDIEEAKAVAFHFMQVAGGHAIELVEYVRLAVAGNADAVVGDVDFCPRPAIGFGAAAADGDVGSVARILHGVVQQVAYDVGQVCAVGSDGQVFGDDVESDMDRLVGLQLVQLYERGQEVGQPYLFEVEAEGLAPFHRHGEYLLYQSAQAAELLLADTQVAFALVGVVGLMEVEQGIGGSISHGDGRLQLVGDVVGEVALHLLQRLLPQDGADEVPEGETEDEEDDRRGDEDARHLPQDEAAQWLGGEPVDIVAGGREGILVADGIGAGYIAGCTARSQGICIHPAVMDVIARVEVLQAVADGDVHLPEAGVEQAVVYTEIGTCQYVEPRVQSALQVNGHAGHSTLVTQQHIKSLLCMKHGTGAYGIRLYPL